MKSPLQNLRRAFLALSLALAATLGALAGAGCYSKVVGGKGIGADSEELRENHEFGTRDPFGQVITRDKR